MSIKVALLKSGESVIADIKELVSDDNVCGYLFENPTASYGWSSTKIKRKFGFLSFKNCRVMNTTYEIVLYD